MSVSLFDTGLILVSVRYVKALKPGAPLSYYRRIPRELQHHYQGKAHIRQSLGTRDLAEATKKASKLAAEHDALWASLRSPEGVAASLTTGANREAALALLTALGLSPGMLAPGLRRTLDQDPDGSLDAYFEKRYGAAYLKARHEPHLTGIDLEDLWNPVEAEAVRLLKEDPSKPRALLSDALAAYLKDHDKGDDPQFAAGATRAIQHVYGAVGDFPLNFYRREHAVQVRDALLKDGNKTATVRRRLNDIKAVFNKGLLEFNLGTYPNPFERLQIAKEDQDSESREPFTAVELQAIVRACRATDDDIRHIVALQADTGARLGEIVGLRVADVMLDHETPHIMIRPHRALGRTLKTVTSERKVPLIGEALWAAQRALEEASRINQGGGWLFPRYASDGNLRPTSASGIVNKWLSRTLRIDKTSHSFRHSMRDRLRHAGVPEEFQNLIGGWGSRSVGQGYGEGYLLRQLKEQLEKVVMTTGKAETSEVSPAIDGVNPRLNS